MIPRQAIRQIQVDEADLEERSMRVIEYVLAFAALAVAGVLALVR